MSWPLAITRNRQALLPIVAAIVALLSGREGLIARGGAPGRAGAAPAGRIRRPPPDRHRHAGAYPVAGAAAAVSGESRGGVGRGRRGTRRPAFRLSDPPQAFARIRPAPPAGVPRIRSFGGFSPFVPLVAPPPPPAPAPRPEPAALVEARPLLRRLAALQGALADLPRQARRMARRLARERATSSHRPPRPPLRIGRPPGWRREADRPVDQVLRGVPRPGARRAPRRHVMNAARCLPPATSLILRCFCARKSLEGRTTIVRPSRLAVARASG